jgi:hypothetical protein
METLTQEKKESLTEVVGKVCDIFASFDPMIEGCPAEKVVALGNVLVAIGEALRDLPLESARRVITSVAILNDIKL